MSWSTLTLKIEIRSDYESELEHGHKERLGKAELCMKQTLDQEELQNLSKKPNWLRRPKLYIIWMYYGGNEW